MSSWSTSLRWMAVFSSLNFLVRSSVGSLGLAVAFGARGGILTGTTVDGFGGAVAEGAGGAGGDCDAGVLGNTLVGCGPVAGAGCGGCSAGDLRVKSPILHPQVVFSGLGTVVSKDIPNEPLWV